MWRGLWHSAVAVRDKDMLSQKLTFIRSESLVPKRSYFVIDPVRSGSSQVRKRDGGLICFSDLFFLLRKWGCLAGEERLQNPWHFMVSLKPCCQVTLKAFKLCSFRDFPQPTSVSEVTEMFSALKMLLWKQKRAEEGGWFLPSPWPGWKTLAQNPHPLQQAVYIVIVICGHSATILPGSLEVRLEDCLSKNEMRPFESGHICRFYPSRITAWWPHSQLVQCQMEHRLKGQIGACVVCEVRTGHSLWLQTITTSEISGRA